MDPKVIHLVFASDHNYAQYVAVALASFAESNPDFTKIVVHLLCDNVNKEIIKRLRKSIVDNRVELNLYNVSASLKSANIRVQNGFSLCAYSRLFLETILPKEIDKVLYLDCDVLVVANLYQLWITDMEYYWVAAVADSPLDSLSRERIGLGREYFYFNSGVILINLKEWRLNNLQVKFCDTIKKYNGYVYHKDQGVLNKVCKDHLLLLPPCYNVQTNFFTHSYELMTEESVPFYSKEEYEQARQTPSIIHFTLGYYNRPWCDKAEHPKAELWRDYRNKTDWRNETLLQDSRLPQIKVLGWFFFHGPYFFYKTVSTLIDVLYRLKH